MSKHQAVEVKTDRKRKPVLVGAAAVLSLLTIGAGAATTTRATANAASLSAPALFSQAQSGLPNSLHSVTEAVQNRQLWTTAGSIGQALTQLPELPAADRSRAIPLGGRPAGPSAHTVSLSVAGRPAVSLTVSAGTVGALLTAQKVVLGPLDTVSPARGTALSDGLVVTVKRVVVAVSVNKVVLREPAAQTVDDPTMVKGTSVVVRPGRSGIQLVTMKTTSVDGKQQSTVRTGSTTMIAPVARITRVGTKTAFTYVGSEVFTNDHSFGVNWDGLAMCESTHNPRAINANPSAGLPTYGMFQFDLPTWASVGGSGNPIDASPEEQLMRAKLLFQSRGLEPWACGYAAG